MAMGPALNASDWLFIVLYMAFALGVGVYFSGRAGRSLVSYFISGRALPWWVLGTSMVATTFAADTPLAVSGLVIKDGISGNWLWWNFILGGTLTVFFFSHLWRRSEVLTEVELIALRYSGRPAAFLRSFKALYLGLPITGLIFGWVTMAMTHVVEVMLGWDKVLSIGVLLLITLIYTYLSGLWGVVTTDVLQFTMAMVGSIVLAILAVNHPQVGGLSGLVEKVDPEKLSLLPSFKEAVPMAFLVMVMVNWWAVYYPGAEPGGGGWVAQRMLAARDERHSVWGTLWFTIAHYVLRPWPWILVGLASLVVFKEELASGMHPEQAYPAMMNLLPHGFKGLLLASFLAAYMSTIDSILTLASSYLVNDFYKPVVKKEAADRHYVRISRLCVVLVMAVGALVSWLLGSVRAGWTLIMELTAGTGLVLLLRWYWWRINTWSEITAIGVSAVTSLLLHSKLASPTLADHLARRLQMDSWAFSILAVVALTTLSWLIVTFLTQPVDLEHLRRFYQKVHPGGFWGPVAKALPGVSSSTNFVAKAIAWFSSSLMIFCFLFGTGTLLLGEWIYGAFFCIIGVLSALILAFFLPVAMGQENKW